MTIISEQAAFPLSSISVSHLRSRTGNDRRHDRAILDFLQLFELGLCPGYVSTETLAELWGEEQCQVSRRMCAIRTLGVVRVLSGKRGRPGYDLEILAKPAPVGMLPIHRRRGQAVERWERLRQLFGLQQRPQQPTTNPQQETH